METIVIYKKEINNIEFIKNFNLIIKKQQFSNR